MSIMCVYYTYVHVRILSYIGALSVTDSDDDYCISYNVTIVDVRSCTRPPRLLDQQHISVKILSCPCLLDYWTTLLLVKVQMTQGHSYLTL